MTACPCRGCKKRYEACWASCPDYIAWNLVREEINRKQRAASEADSVAIETVLQIKRAKRKGGPT